MTQKIVIVIVIWFSCGRFWHTSSSGTPITTFAHISFNSRKNYVYSVQLVCKYVYMYVNVQKKDNGSNQNLFNHIITSDEQNLTAAGTSFFVGIDVVVVTIVEIMN